MNEHKEWFLLAGTVVGAIAALTAGPHLFAAAAAGIVLGLVFAPKSGRETRRVIGGWARRIGSPDDDAVSTSDKTY